MKIGIGGPKPGEHIDGSACRSPERTRGSALRIRPSSYASMRHQVARTTGGLRAMRREGYESDPPGVAIACGRAAS